MRITEVYKRFGFFWFVSEPENKIPGILSIKDGGCIELEIFCYSSAQYNYNNEQLYHVVGVVEKDGNITLSDCRFLLPRYNYKNGIYQNILSVKKAFIGHQYAEDKKMQFNTFSFSVEGLHQWIPRRGISNGNIEPITCRIDSNMCLSFQFIENNRLEDNINLLKEQITWKAYCKLIAQKEQNLKDLILICRKITNFLCFAMDSIVCINDVKVTSDEIQEDNNKIPTFIKVYYSSRPFIRISQKNIFPLFTCELIENNIGQVINDWIKIYDNTHPALELYFSTQTGEHKFLDAKFLTLVQSIEAYQQRMLRKKLSFKEVLNEIMKPFNQWISNKDILVEKIKNTRDYFTHYNPEKENKKLYEELLILYLKLEIIFQMTLLKALKFDISLIKSIVLNNDKSERKFKLLNNT